MQTIKLECLATANRVMAVIRRIHREMDSDFLINNIKDRRIITGRANQEEILQREGHMRIRTRNKKHQRVTESSTPRGFGSGYSKTNDDVKRCHHCGSDQHLARECEKAKGNQGTQEKRADFRSMKINSVHLQPSKENLDLQKINQTLKVNRVKSDPIWLDYYGNQYDPDNPTAHRDSAQNARVNHIQVRPKEEVDEETETKTVMKCGMNVKTNHHKIMPEQMILKPAVKQGDNNALKKVQLEHVIVEIQGKETEKGSIVKVNALSDSGVISEELIEGMNLEQVGEVSLQCVAGEAIPAKLVEVKVRIRETPSDTDEENRTNQVKLTIT